MPLFSLPDGRPGQVPRRLLASIMDIAGFTLCGLLAFQLRFDGSVPAIYAHGMGEAILIWAVAKTAAFFFGAVNSGYWRYTSLDEAVRIGLANSAGSLVGGVLIVLAVRPGIPRSIYILEWLTSCAFTLGTRCAVRLAKTARRENGKSDGEWTRTLIYGAGTAGLALARELRENPSLKSELVGLIDDDRHKVGLTFHGTRVLGTGEALGALAKKYEIEQVLIAIPSATGPQLVRMLQSAIDAEVDYKMVPGLADIIHGTELGKQIRDVAVEDLLGRRPVLLDEERIRERIAGKTVMVTGAAGSIGSEICRQIARFNPAALVGFDEAETPLFQLDRELNNKFPQLTFFPELGNITRSGNVQQAMERYKPSIVYHAAAYKHVPMMERHVFAAVENNIFGTWNVASAAIDHKVEDFVMISSDKAVRPTSMMGATKRISELVINALQKQGSTRFMAVRFGNVLGSNGSVVPIFKEQIAAGGPVTITHPEMRRYFMTIPEATQLVLQAFSIGKGGEVFVLDMGEPVRIVDLARNLVLLSGLRPDRDIKFEFTGLRPGEKLFEELNLQSEQFMPTAHAKILSYLSPFSADLKVMHVALEELRQISERKDVARLVLYLKELIPDYNPGSPLLKLALSPPATQGMVVKPNHPQAVAPEWQQPLGTPANLLN
ncbi:MAG: nucleoside-diphosphate sugar epimerase/dehydratase [Acidobacteriaceae bacterium]|jgi:FlaA1/EpsC-like NDP-sugar epimerase